MRSLAIALCCASLFTSGARADEPHITAQPVKTSVEQEPINTVEPIFRAFLTLGGDKFTFIIPETFRMGGDSEKGRLTLSSTKGDTVVTLAFLDTAELSVDAYREMLSKRFEDGKIVREFSRPALGHSCHTFDLEWTGPAGMARSSNAIFIPTHAGLLEVTITSSRIYFPKAQSMMNSILCSLAGSVNGKLEVVHLSNVN